MMLMAGTDAYDDEKTITVYRLIFQALLPATLGNLVGGGFVIGAVYWYAFDSMETQNRFRERIQRAWAHNPRYYRGTYRGRIPGLSGAVSRTSPAISVHGIDDMETAPAISVHGIDDMETAPPKEVEV
jgi:hypothetical protein